METDDPLSLHIDLVRSPIAGQVQVLKLTLPAGSTVGDAIRLAGWELATLAAADGTLRLGVWGRRCALDQPLRDRDRVELYRDLLIEPVESRRRRQRAQGKRRRP